MHLTDEPTMPSARSTPPHPRTPRRLASVVWALLLTLLAFAATASAQDTTPPPEGNDELADVFNAWFQEARAEREASETASQALISAHPFVGAAQEDTPPLAGTASSSQFLARDPWHFGPATPQAVAADLGRWVQQLRADVAEDAQSAAFAYGVPPLIVLLFIGLFLYYQRRAHQFAEELARLTDGAEEETLRDRRVQRLAFRVGGAVATPFALWILTQVPLRGLMHDAIWPIVLGNVLGFVTVYALLTSAAREALSGHYFRVDEIVGQRLLTTIRLAGLLVVALLSMHSAVTEWGYRDDLIALIGFLLRLSLTLVSIRLFVQRSDLIALLPERGGTYYERLRDQLQSHLGQIMGLSVFLMVLWSAGFSHAASTLLLRGYGLIGLLVASALVLRWIETHHIDKLTGTESLTDRILHQTSLMLRVLTFMGVAAGAIHLTGLQGLFDTLLQFPLYKSGDAAFTGRSLLVGVTIFMVAVLVARGGRVVFEEVLQRAFPNDPGVAYAGATAGYYVALLVAALMGLLAMGFDLTTLAVFAASIGVGIGLALQDIARNLVSGMILLFGRSVAKHDFVTVSDGLYGQVTNIGARSVTVRSADNLEYVVPANELVNSTVINWSHTDRYARLHIPVGVSYGSDVSKVREALMRAARSFPAVLSDPPYEPDVWLTEFADSSVNLALLVWIDLRSSSRLETEGKILFRVWEIFHEEQIEIPFPQRDIHLRTAEGLKELASLLETRPEKKAPPK